jgi:tRNA dimethylallyltransferase
LWQHLDGHFDIDEAINRAVVASRQLAKRQLTWLRKWSDAERIIIDDGEQLLSCEKICKQTLKILSNHSIL